MNRLVLSVLALAAAACSPSADRADRDAATQTQTRGNGDTRTYALKDFDRVSVKAGIELILKQGPFAVEARSSDGDLSKLIVDVQGSELVISRETVIGNIGISPNYTVTATAPAWTAIEGLAGVRIEGENLNLEVVTVEVAAGASVELSGTCREITVEATAGASIDADQLKCAAATAKAAAGSTVELHATERAKGTASAGATIEFSGKPPAFEQDADISSTVKLE
jgi:hypothetical protein